MLKATFGISKPKPNREEEFQVFFDQPGKASVIRIPKREKGDSQVGSRE